MNDLPVMTARPVTEPRDSAMVSSSFKVGVLPNPVPKRSTSPSTSTIVDCTASHSVNARSATASSTGRTSPGELEITRRISLIAVCCPRESFSSLVRSSTLRSRPAYDSRNCDDMWLNRLASASSSSPV
ncbi:MAG: hypothetical protein IPI73_11330 [Betaproteobacteria bacterium]|nr:hypothetical protein [Betaproteobacteria bacterium]